MLPTKKIYFDRILVLGFLWKKIMVAEWDFFNFMGNRSSGGKNKFLAIGNSETDYKRSDACVHAQKCPVQLNVWET